MYVLSQISGRIVVQCSSSLQVAEKRIRVAFCNSEGPGLFNSEYQNITTYLTSLTYPLGTTEKERSHIRRTAKKYSVFRDVLPRKNPTSRFPYHRAVPLRHQIPDVLRDNHDHWIVGHQDIRVTFRKVARIHYWSL
jgi:hypothetical protein